MRLCKISYPGFSLKYIKNKYIRFRSSVIGHRSSLFPVSLTETTNSGSRKSRDGDPTGVKNTGESHGVENISGSPAK
ncbi:hypothetical protein Hanom_Chr14g01277451 [Helianthus anomalus]